MAEETTAGHGQFELECIILGPADLRRGRDYGLRAGGKSLSDAGRAMLEDFCLSLSEWTQRGDPPPFEILFWLGAEDKSYALLKCAYLGVGTMGTVALAQGLLIPMTAMVAMDGHAHRLLDSIPEPMRGEWTAHSIAWQQRGPRIAPGRQVTELGAQLRRGPLPWPVVHIVDWELKDSRERLLDAIEWSRASILPGWCTSIRLPRIGRFVPGDLPLRMPTIAELPADGRGGVYVRGDQVVSGLGRIGPEVRLHDQLFGIGRDEAEGKLSRRLVDAIGRWSSDYSGRPPRQMVAYAIDDVLRLGLSSDEFWSLLEILARRAAKIGDEDLKVEATRGIETFFARATTAEPAAFAPLLMAYLERVASFLPGQGEEPLRLAIERDILGHLDPDELCRLFERGLADRFSRELAVLLERHAERRPDDPDRVGAEMAAVVAEALSQSLAGREHDEEALALLGASMGLSAAVAKTTRDPRAADRLARAMNKQEKVLTSAPMRALPGWADAAFGFLPKLFAFLMSRLPATGLPPDWTERARRLLREQPERLCLSGSNPTPDSEAIALMLFVAASVRPDAMEQRT